jgi:hypothetical protein
MLRAKDREDLEHWFQWLLDPAFCPKRQRNPNVPRLRNAVNALKKARAKEEKPNSTVEPLLLTAQENAQEALRVSDFHTYHTPTPGSEQGPEHPVRFEVNSMSGGAGNYAEAEHLFVAVCIAKLLWPEDDPHQRVVQHQVGKAAYDNRVAHGWQPGKQVRMRVKRFTKEAVFMRGTAIRLTWNQFKFHKKWDRISPDLFSGVQERGLKAVRLALPTKRELRFIGELSKVQLQGWAPPPQFVTFYGL